MAPHLPHPKLLRPRFCAEAFLGLKSEFGQASFCPHSLAPVLWEVENGGDPSARVSCETVQPGSQLCPGRPGRSELGKSWGSGVNPCKLGFQGSCGLTSIVEN